MISVLAVYFALLLLLALNIKFKFMQKIAASIYKLVTKQNLYVEETAPTGFETQREGLLNQ